MASSAISSTRRLGDCPDRTAMFACGPAPMLTALRVQLADRDDVELHFERFAAPPVIDGEAPCPGLGRWRRPPRYVAHRPRAGRGGMMLICISRAAQQQLLTLDL
jgi:ferredoxin-NADP reductase